MKEQDQQGFTSITGGHLSAGRSQPHFQPRPEAVQRQHQHQQQTGSATLLPAWQHWHSLVLWTEQVCGALS